MTNQLTIVYGLYALAVVGLAVWLARTLFTNGAVFLADLFPDRPELAEAVNRLLVTGFAMLNLGFGFFLLRGGHAETSTEAFEVLATKLGVLLVSLAIFHFANIVVFQRIANRHRQAVLVPPVAPQVWIDPNQVQQRMAAPAGAAAGPANAPAASTEGWAR